MEFLALIFLPLIVTSAMAISSNIGINYGRVANNIPSPYRTIGLLQSMQASRIKLYDANPEILKLLAGTKIQVSIMVPNDQISFVASSQLNADQWVRDNVLAYYPDTMIRLIFVGNEILSYKSDADKQVWPFLVPAMRRIKNALAHHKIKNIKITTALAMDMLESTSPPSSSRFRPDMTKEVIYPLLHFLNGTRSYFFVNVYTYFPWTQNPSVISLDSALHITPTHSYQSYSYQSYLAANITKTNTNTTQTTHTNGTSVNTHTNGTSVNTHTNSTSVKPHPNTNANTNRGYTYTDTRNGLVYTNLLDQMLDSVIAAMKASGFGNVLLGISETGWPNSGDFDEPGANRFNAATYNRNIVKRMTAVPPAGTPARPAVEIPTFLFSLYDENLKDGHGTERHWGLLNANGRPVYDIDLTGKRPESAYPELPKPTNNDGYKGKVWCVAATGVDEVQLGTALTFACGSRNGMCDPLAPGRECYEPISVTAHASFAFSTYWATFRNGGATCHFNGLAVQTTTDPSTEFCKYPSVTL